MILYKLTEAKTGRDIIGKNLIRELQTFLQKDYITKDSKPYEVDKNSLMISFDNGKTWGQTEDSKEKIKS